jgi:hypothetical protein
MSKTIFAIGAVLAFTTAAPVNAETLLFSDPNAIQDWWYTDETADGSLMLSTKSNDPSELPFYLICKDRKYSILFQPPVPPVQGSSGALVYRYWIDSVWGNPNRQPHDVISASVHENHADRIQVSGDALAPLLHGEPFLIHYESSNGKGKGYDSPHYIPPPLSAARLFSNRCVNQGYQHEPPPPPPPAR